MGEVLKIKLPYFIYDILFNLKVLAMGEVLKIKLPYFIYDIYLISRFSP